MRVMTDAGLDREVGPLQRRPQIGLAGAPALAVLDGELEEADAFLLRAVEIVVEPVARRLRGLAATAARRDRYRRGR